MTVTSTISPKPQTSNARERSRQRLTNLVQQQGAPNSWYRITNEAGAPTRVDIYDEIGGGDWWSSGVTAVDFVAELAGITGDLEVHINSPGGDVFDGLAIYNALAQRTSNVTTIVDGLAASAASFIAQAGKTRVMSPGAMMMIHDAAGLCVGNAADMRELADLLDKVSDNLADIYAAHSGVADGWRDAMRAESWYTAQEAVDAGLAHRVAERPASEALEAAARFDLSAYLHAPHLSAAATDAEAAEAGAHDSAQAAATAAAQGAAGAEAERPDDGGAAANTAPTDQAGLPDWLTETTAPLPAWLQPEPAKEAT